MRIFEAVIDGFRALQSLRAGSCRACVRIRCGFRIFRRADEHGEQHREGADEDPGRLCDDGPHDADERFLAYDGNPVRAMSFE